ncbi:MAG: type II secretion system protein [Planctomycetaceae bacterium]
MQRSINTTDSRSREGFTMIELLVVMTIIALLFGAVLFAMGRSTENARVAGTRTLLKQIDAAIQDRLEAFQRHSFRSEASAIRAKYNSIVSPTSNLDGADLTQLETLVRKVRYREMLPQRKEDLFGLDNTDNSGTDDDAQYWKWVRTKDSNPSSTELLYAALTRGPSYGGAPLQLDDIPSQYIVDSDGDGLLEFVDGWGQPLRFYNAPTGLLRPSGYATADISILNQQNARVFVPGLPDVLLDPSMPSDVSADDYASQLNRDPLDPLGDLQSMMSGGGAIAAWVTARFRVDDMGVWDYSAPNTYYTPLVVSAGSDEQLGLKEPSGTGAERLGVVESPPDAIYDNLTNRQRGGL